jgi:hypothetical protein
MNRKNPCNPQYTNGIIIHQFESQTEQIESQPNQFESQSNQNESHLNQIESLSNKNEQLKNVKQCNYCKKIFSKH